VVAIHGPADVELTVDGAEDPAVGALGWIVADHGDATGATIDGRHPLEQGSLRLARVAHGDDITRARAQPPHHEQAIAGLQARLHAAALDDDAAQHRITGGVAWIR
jgi:hypothetical protein